MLSWAIDRASPEKLSIPFNKLHLFLFSKGITTEKPDPPSDSEDEDGNETKKPRPPPPPPQKIVKSPPSTKRNSKIPSIKSPTETVKEPEKWIDYRGK